MHLLEYAKLDSVNPNDLVSLLNKPRIREHLITHDQFDLVSGQDWIAGKMKVDATPGCKVRAILLNKRLIGWCGIQIQGDEYELAIVINEHAWGYGKLVFRDLMNWARDFGHDSICIHLLHTRREFDFLRKLSRQVSKSEILGERFTTYQIEVK